METAQLSITLMRLSKPMVVIHNQQPHSLFGISAVFQAYPKAVNIERLPLLNTHHAASLIPRFVPFVSSSPINSTTVSLKDAFSWDDGDIISFMLQHSTLKCRIVTSDLCYLNALKDSLY